MLERVKQYRAANRLAREGYARALAIQTALRSGEKRTDEAKRLQRQIQPLRKAIGEGSALHRSRVQYLQNQGINRDGSSAHAYLSSVGLIGLKNAIPSIIDRVNNGDQDAIPFAAATVSLLSNMDPAKRPMAPAKFARMVPLPEHDAATVELEEARFLIECMDIMLPRLSAGQLLTADQLASIGLKRRELRDGLGLRDISELVEDDAGLRKPPEDQPETEEDADEATPDTDESESPDDDEGQVEQAPDEPAGDDDDAEAPDTEGDDQQRPEGAEEEEAS